MRPRVLSAGGLAGLIASLSARGGNVRIGRPVPGRRGLCRLSGCPAAFWTVSALSLALELLRLLLLRQGLRRAFPGGDGSRPRDWLAPGIAAWLGVAALAAWGTAEPVPAGGSWVAYGRLFLALGLFIAFFLLLRRQLLALSLRGYQVTVSPVRLSSGGVWCLSLGITLALLLPGST